MTLDWGRTGTHQHWWGIRSCSVLRVEHWFADHALLVAIHYFGHLVLLLPVLFLQELSAQRSAPFPCFPCFYSK